MTYPIQTKTDFVAGSVKIFTKATIHWQMGALENMLIQKAWVSLLCLQQQGTSKDNAKLANTRLLKKLHASTFSQMTLQSSSFKTFFFFTAYGNSFTDQGTAQDVKHVLKVLGFLVCL